MIPQSGISNEFRIVAACCRWPRGPARDATVREAASGAVDWTRVERVARRHRVFALVHNGLVDAGVAVPQATAKRLADEARRVRMTALAMAREAVLLQDAFDAAGCPALFVKGASLAVLAYGDIGLKQAWDIDLLTTPESAARGCAILERNGYALVEPASLDGRRLELFMELVKECVLVHPEKRIAVELHWRLVDNPHLLPGIDARSPTQAVGIGAQQLRTLPDAELLAYLTVHGTRSAWMRLKWLADVAALLSRYETAELDALYRRLHALGTGRAAGVALLLCNQLLGIALPDALLAELRGDRGTNRLAATAVAALTYGEGERAFPDHSRLGFRVRFAKLGIAPGWRYLAAELGSIWRSPVDRLALPLPRGLAFLYHVLRIPLWAFRRLAALRRPPSPEPG